MIKVYRIKADNFDNVLVSKEAYNKYIVPSMSTGDWHTHTKTIVEVKDWEGVITQEDFEDEYELHVCPTCGR